MHTHELPRTEGESGLEAGGQEDVRVETTPARDETAELELGKEIQKRPPAGEDETPRVGLLRGLRRKGEMGKLRW